MGLWEPAQAGTGLSRKGPSGNWSKRKRSNRKNNRATVSPAYLRQPIDTRDRRGDRPLKLPQIAIGRRLLAPAHSNSFLVRTDPEVRWRSERPTLRRNRNRHPHPVDCAVSVCLSKRTCGAGQPHGAWRRGRRMRSTANEQECTSVCLSVCALRCVACRTCHTGMDTPLLRSVRAARTSCGCPNRLAYARARVHPMLSSGVCACECMRAYAQQGRAVLQLTCRKCVGAVAGFCSRSTIGTGGLVLAPDRLAALPPCHTAGFLYPGNRYMLFFE
jgi:hypothetical protein